MTFLHVVFQGPDSILDLFIQVTILCVVHKWDLYQKRNFKWESTIAIVFKQNKQRQYER